MVPPSKPFAGYSYRPNSIAPLPFVVRGLLIVLALGVLAVFAVALRLNPYQRDGSPRQLATHQQLGLPPCSFLEITGYPCPSCGMTTSFSLLIRGDLFAALQANWVGALLAGFCLLFVPWAILGAWLGRTPFIRSLDQALLTVVLVLLLLLILRWAVVVGLGWSQGELPISPYG